MQTLTYLYNIGTIFLHKTCLLEVPLKAK